ncbi:MAG: hypothetical protein QME94_04745 [Anaerolineae bacterium]|nr:hypothetical protein [Anaerolineae bacterium]
MAKLLFVVAWPATLLILALQAWRTGLGRALKALVQGTLWWDVGQGKALTASTQVFLWLAHAGGLAYLWRIAGRSYGEALPLGLASAAVLLLPQLPSLCRGRAPDATALSPLALPYVAALLLGLHLLPPGKGHTLLRVTTVAAAGYAALVQAQRFWPLRLRGRALPVAALLLIGVAVAWASVEYFGGCTRGVTGSDPYCYAQMAVDIARRGDPRHIFTLSPTVTRLGIAWWPIVHVGYYPPGGAEGISPTVWPVGWPAILALGYLALGEGGLYVWAPLMGLLALLGVTALLCEVWPEEQAQERWLGIALAILILATSREQVLQLLVPMADVPTQLFTVLAVWLALRAARVGSWALALLSGAALGVAYDIRHTQVILAPVLALALWQRRGRGLRWRLLASAGVGACLVALPDLWYHAVAFGSPWRPESPELGLISVRFWWGNALRMASAAAAWPEFGLLLPLLAYGLWRLWRERRARALVLASWVLLNAGSQFLYGPLRWRDLLAVVPPLVLFTAYGATSLLARLRARPRLAGWAPGCLALTLAVALTLRMGPMVEWPFREVEETFGYVAADQRQAFSQIAELTEESAVVGTSLNSGPVELYANRQAFRPGDWTEVELEVFLRAMAEAGRPVYLIDDGNEHRAVVERLAAGGRLEPVCRLAVPLYGDRERLTGMLYRVGPGGRAALPPGSPGDDTYLALPLNTW